MNKNQLNKVVNDYSLEKGTIEYQLRAMKVQERALKSRLKLVNRKINILNNKIINSQNEEINFSCNDFDSLDMLY